MSERKVSIYFESKDVNEEEFLDYVHGFFCKDPRDPKVEDCRLYAVTWQNVEEKDAD
jgi:hypothetical protein